MNSGDGHCASDADTKYQRLCWVPDSHTNLVQHIQIPQMDPNDVCAKVPTGHRHLHQKTRVCNYAQPKKRKKKHKKNIQLALMGLHWVFASKMLQGQMRAQGATPRHGPYLRMEIQTWSSRQSHLEGYSQVQKQKTVGDFRTFAYFPAISFSLGRNPTYFPIIV